MGSHEDQEVIQTLAQNELCSVGKASMKVIQTPAQEGLCLAARNSMKVTSMGIMFGCDNLSVVSSRI